MYGTIRTHQWRFPLGIPSSLNWAIYETVLPFREKANGTIINARPYLPSFVRKRLATYRTQITNAKIGIWLPWNVLRIENHLNLEWGPLCQWSNLFECTLTVVRSRVWIKKKILFLTYWVHWFLGKGYMCHYLHKK